MCLCHAGRSGLYLFMCCLEGCLEHLDLLLCFLLPLLSNDRVQVCSHLCSALMCPGLL